MPRTLREVLTLSEEKDVLRWEVAVPLGTNPFILAELLQFACVGAALVLIALSFGIYLTEGTIYAADLGTLLLFSGFMVLVILGVFFLIVFLLFKNRYYTVYSLDASGVFYEGIKGSDERKTGFFLRARPYPVLGEISASRSRSRHLTWEKIGRFQNIPGMRVVLLKRGIWHMLKLYSPDESAHAALVAYLCEFVPER